ncbi:threonylcarbamoyl-AMP synthase [bacterium]|nr:threonylcarbamoyl-AMP synthase [bacterium]
MPADAGAGRQVTTRGGRWLDRDAATQALADGQVVLLNTDTLPGLHARLDRPEALDRVAELKGRAPDKPLLVLASSGADALPLLARTNEPCLDYMRRCWPGPFTLILPGASWLPGAVRSATGTVAVRVPGRDALRQLLTNTGPLASTSANAAGDAPATTLADAVSRFPGLGAWDDGQGDGLDAASAIIALGEDGPRVLREGPAAPPAWRP